MIVINAFLGGIMVASFAASGLFFLKFYRASKDNFFLLFALACEMLALERIVSMMTSVFLPIDPDATDSRFWIYLLRLTAFILILTAVIIRNRSSKSLKSRD